jgi:hypothetical protein
MPYRRGISRLPKYYVQRRSKNGFKAVAAKRYGLPPDFLELWGLTPYAFGTLRSDGEQLNGNQS